MRSHWLILGVAVLASSGCGVSGADSLFSSGGGSQGGSGQGGTTSTIPVGSGGGQGGAPGTMSNSSTSTATNSTSSNSSSSTGSTGGGGSTSSSSGTGGAPDTLRCGDGVICNRGDNRSCCWDTFSDDPSPGRCVQGQPGQDGCNTFQGQNGDESRITCEFPAQCDGGKVCCGHRVFVTATGAYYDHVDCQATCPDPNVQLCDPTQPDALTCPLDTTQVPPVQETCIPSSLLPSGYFVCTSQ